MGVTVTLSPALRRFTGGIDRLGIDDHECSPGELVQRVAGIFPALHRHLFLPDGRLRATVTIVTCPHGITIHAHHDGMRTADTVMPRAHEEAR